MQSDIIDVGLALKYFDKNDFLLTDSLKMNKLWPLHLLTTETKTHFHYYNTCIVHLGFILDMNAWIDKMTNKAVNLITIIQKEYH